MKIGILYNLLKGREHGISSRVALYIVIKSCLTLQHNITVKLFMNNTFLSGLARCSPPLRGGDSQIEWMGMPVVSLRGVNFGFWSCLGCSGQNVIIFSQQGLVNLRVAREEILFFLFVYFIYWSFLGVCISFGHTQIGLF